MLSEDIADDCVGPGAAAVAVDRLAGCVELPGVGLEGVGSLTPRPVFEEDCSVRTWTSENVSAANLSVFLLGVCDTGRGRLLGVEFEDCHTFFSASLNMETETTEVV